MNNSCEILDNDNFIVFGAALSGMAAARLLRSMGKTVAVYDEAPPEMLESRRDELVKIGVPLLTELDYEAFPYFTLDDGHGESIPSMWDVMVLSPGIPTNHDLVATAVERGCVVRSEIEIGYHACPVPLIGITGTNGKTTVTHLVSHILLTAGIAAPIAGNVGRPLSDVVSDPILRAPKALVVCEVSSYQLETIEYFSPKVACVTNITPDHLDRYVTMDNYVEAKRWITANQKDYDFLVLNGDDGLCLSFGPRSRAKVRTFSTRHEVEAGAWLSDEYLYLNMPDMDEAVGVMKRDEIPLPGIHNVENVLAAMTICACLEVAPGKIAEAVRTFQAVPHRIEKVCTIDGVDYFNDSKATNLDSMSKALVSFDRPIVLIAGGRDKGSPWTKLNEVVKERVKGLVMIGEATPIGMKAWGEIVPNAKTAENMQEAVELAKEMAETGDVILLSPGCASFDMYKNFEERGDDFKKTVQSIAKREIA